MNPLRFILLAISLPLLLGGCGEKHEGVNERELEKREGMAYLKGAPYTGKTYSLDYAQKRKLRETNYKDGKKDGLSVYWHENGHKWLEENYKDHEVVSMKLWNSKGEPVESMEEAQK